MASKWTQVKVGDFLKVGNREMLPADIVLVSAFEPDPAIPVGACYVETKSLDVRAPPRAAAAARQQPLPTPSDAAAAEPPAVGHCQRPAALGGRCC